MSLESILRAAIKARLETELPGVAVTTCRYGQPAAESEAYPRVDVSTRGKSASVMRGCICHKFDVLVTIRTRTTGANNNATLAAATAAVEDLFYAVCASIFCDELIRSVDAEGTYARVDTFPEKGGIYASQIGLAIPCKALVDQDTSSEVIADFRRAYTTINDDTHVITEVSA